MASEKPQPHVVARMDSARACSAIEDAVMNDDLAIRGAALHISKQLDSIVELLAMLVSEKEAPR